ncbi:MAG: putative integral membrane protein [Gammaproteobacteria bacterium]|jgi:uncharacterized integral membrane protein
MKIDNHLWHKLKMIGVGVLCFVGLILIIQNVETVETRLLFHTFSLPRAFLLSGTFIVGFALGSLWITNKTSKHAARKP